MADHDFRTSTTTTTTTDVSSTTVCASCDAAAKASATAPVKRESTPKVKTCNPQNGDECFSGVYCVNKRDRCA